MKATAKFIGVMVGTLMLGSAPASAISAEPPAQGTDTVTPSASFVSADFAVPTRVEGNGFTLQPLGPDLVDIDFAAYMSSIEHLQTTFTRSTSWPHKDVSAADAMRDMETEQARFARRETFAYAVLTPDGSRERGCVYVYPSTVEGFDAVVTLWVTKAEFDAGFDHELYAWVTAWVKKEWPFARVAYPGRAIEWKAWDAMVAASAPEKTAAPG